MNINISKNSLVNRRTGFTFFTVQLALRCLEDVWRAECVSVWNLLSASVVCYRYDGVSWRRRPWNVLGWQQPLGPTSFLVLCHWAKSFRLFFYSIRHHI